LSFDIQFLRLVGSDDRIPLFCLTTSHFVFVPSKNLDFRCHLSWSLFMINELRWEVLFILLILMELLTTTAKCDVVKQNNGIRSSEPTNLRNWISNDNTFINNMHWFTSTQKDGERYCSFCWYWWSCWPPLYKLFIADK
jgi:hypothetical protein